MHAMTADEAATLLADLRTKHGDFALAQLCAQAFLADYTAYEDEDGDEPDQSDVHEWAGDLAEGIALFALPDAD